MENLNKEIVRQAKPRVELIAHTPNPEHIITAGAKLCYSSSSISELLENNTDEKVAKFINMIMKTGHGSVLEHAVFTFGVEGISRITEIQLLRKRTASPSVQSGRYVMRDSAEYAIPPQIRNSQRAFDLYMKQLESCQKTYIELIDILKEENPGKDEKLIIEDARYIQPQSLGTKLMFTIDLRNLIELISLRKCKRAQWEVGGVILQMEKLISEIIPNVSKFIGAPCETGVCTEGKLCCGKPYPKKIDIVKKGDIKNEIR